MIAHRKVGATDRPLKQHVADDRELGGRVVEDDMAWRVTRAVAHVEGEVADRHLVAIDQPAVAFEDLAPDAIGAAVVFQP